MKFLECLTGPVCDAVSSLTVGPLCGMVPSLTRGSVCDMDPLTI